MTFVTPLTSIRILKGIPLKSDYKHTITFTSKQAQSDYFVSKTFHAMDNATPIKAPYFQIKANKNADELQGCNYVMFQNLNYGSKWFYGFIEDIAYSTPQTSYLTIKIDVMQTWLFDWKIMPSYVERCHVADDSLYSQTVEEPVSVGYYETNDVTEIYDTGYFVRVFYTPYNNDSLIEFPEVSPQSGKLVDNVYSGYRYMDFSESGGGSFGSFAQLNTMLENFAKRNAINNIAGIWMIPQLNPTILFGATIPIKGNFKGYAPKNNKLFNHPYTFCTIESTDGQKAEFKPQLCNGSLKLKGVTSFIPPISVMLVPTYDGQDENLRYSVTFSSYAMGSFATNTYNSWVGQQTIKLPSMLFSLGLNALGSVGAGATGNISGALMGATSIVSSGVDLFTQGELIKQQGDVGIGSVASGNVLMSTKKTGFVIKIKQVNRDNAEAIDSFFSTYGYAQHKIMPVNYNTRPNWNYIKTQNVIVKGDIPTKAIDEISDVFNSGVTFWHSPTAVGNYSINNK